MATIKICSICAEDDTEGKSLSDIKAVKPTVNFTFVETDEGVTFTLFKGERTESGPGARALEICKDHGDYVRKIIDDFVKHAAGLETIASIQDGDYVPEETQEPKTPEVSDEDTPEDYDEDREDDESDEDGTEEDGEWEEPSPEDLEFYGSQEPVKEEPKKTAASLFAPKFEEPVKETPKASSVKVKSGTAAKAKTGGDGGPSVTDIRAWLKDKGYPVKEIGIIRKAWKDLAITALTGGNWQQTHAELIKSVK